jgi:hypothetical protein
MAAMTAMTRDPGDSQFLQFWQPSPIAECRPLI